MFLVRDHERRCKASGPQPTVGIHVVTVVSLLVAYAAISLGMTGCVRVTGVYKLHEPMAATRQSETVFSSEERDSEAVAILDDDLLTLTSWSTAQSCETCQERQFEIVDSEELELLGGGVLEVLCYATAALSYGVGIAGIAQDSKPAAGVGFGLGIPLTVVPTINLVAAAKGRTRQTGETTWSIDRSLPCQHVECQAIPSSDQLAMIWPQELTAEQVRSHQMCDLHSEMCQPTDRSGRVVFDVSSWPDRHLRAETMYAYLWDETGWSRAATVDLGPSPSHQLAMERVADFGEGLEGKIEKLQAESERLEVVRQILSARRDDLDDRVRSFVQSPYAERDHHEFSALDSDIESYTSEVRSFDAEVDSVWSGASWLLEQVQDAELDPAAVESAHQRATSIARLGSSARSTSVTLELALLPDDFIDFMLIVGEPGPIQDVSMLATITKYDLVEIESSFIRMNELDTVQLVATMDYLYERYSITEFLENEEQSRIALEIGDLQSAQWISDRKITGGGLTSRAAELDDEGSEFEALVIIVAYIRGCALVEEKRLMSEKRANSSVTPGLLQRIIRSLVQEETWSTSPASLLERLEGREAEVGQRIYDLVIGPPS